MLSLSKHRFFFERGQRLVRFDHELEPLPPRLNYTFAPSPVLTRNELSGHGLQEVFITKLIVSLEESLKIVAGAHAGVTHCFETMAKRPHTMVADALARKPQRRRRYGNRHAAFRRGEDRVGMVYIGDGATSTEANPRHTYATVGTYTAKLTVTYADGETATVQSTVTVGCAVPDSRLAYGAV